MLTKPLRRAVRRSLHSSQRGVVLIIALIIMVAMTLAALALIRSVDTSNIIAGNLAFQQGATHSADSAIETAISWLENCSKGTGGCAIGTLNNSDSTNGYIADGLALNPSTQQPLYSPTGSLDWDSFWNTYIGAANSKSVGTDAAGYTRYYAIHRMCAKPGTLTGGANCAVSWLTTLATGNEEEAGSPPLESSSLIYYRITVKVTGPRNSLSYVQAMVAL